MAAWYFTPQSRIKMSTTEKKLYAVIGDPVGHSLSPAMHNGAFASLGMNAEYIAVRVAAEDLKDFTDSARSKLSGFNITVPHKNAVIPYLDEVSGLASLCGSVNTVIVSEDGKLSGDTTDGYGLSGALREAFAFDFKDSAVTFIGCGGVVNALAFHAAFSGASSVRIINRTLEKAQVLASKLCAAFPECSFDIAFGAETRKIREFLNTSAACGSVYEPRSKDGDPAPVDPVFFPA